MRTEQNLGKCSRQHLLTLLRLSFLENLILFVVRSPSHVQLFAAPWTAALQAFLSPIISWSLPRSMSILSVMPSKHLILCCPLLLLPSIFPSIKVFFSESAVHNRWPIYWSFTFSLSPYSEYSGLISFRNDWLDPLAVPRTQAPSPAPQLESINSLALCLLYGPAITTVCDYWKDHIYSPD